MTRARSGHAGDFAYALALTVMLTLAGWIGVTRNGSWDQVPHWDSAAFYEEAREFSDAVKTRGAAGFVDAWAHGNETHAPLVPAVSGLVMAVLGDSFRAALCVLPLFAAVWCVSLVKIVRRLYPDSTATVRLATFATACFPLVLNQSRLYLFEFPGAALGAATVWALLASENLTRSLPCAAAGVLAGLTGLVRAGAPALLLGPAAVVAAAALAERGRGVKLWNLGLAAVTAIAVSTTWYLPHLTSFLRYLHTVTYGSEALVFAEGDSGFSLANTLYFVKHNVCEGAGAPLLALAAAAYATSCLAGRRLLMSRTMLALGAVYAITFVVLLAVAQRCGAVLFLPVIGVQGIVVARAVESLPWRWTRWTGRAAVVALSLQHLMSLTFGVNPDAGVQDFRGPYGSRFPLWDHNDTFLAVTEHSKPRVDYATGLAETARRVLAEPSVRGGPVLLLAHHPFVNVSNMLGEAPAWPRSLFLARLPILTENAVRGELPFHARNVMAARAVLTRVSAPGDAVPEEGRYLEILKGLTSGPTRVFDRADPPIRFTDGSTIVVYLRRPELDAATGALLADLERRPVASGGTIAFLSDHALFELLAIDVGDWHIRQGRAVEVTLPVADSGISSEGCLSKALELAERGSLIVTRSPAGSAPSPREAAWSPYLTALRLGSTPLVRRRIPEIVLPDGSTVRVEEYNESADALARPMARRVVEALKERVSPAVAIAADSPIVAALRQYLSPHASDGGWSLYTFPGPCDFDASFPPLDADAVRRARESMGRADVLVKCFDAELDTLLGRAARRAVAPLVSGPTRRFEPMSAAAGGGAWTTRSGAGMNLFASVPSVEWPAAVPSGWTPLDAPFEPPAGSPLVEAAVRLVAYDIHNSDGWVRIDLGLTPLADRDHLPAMTVRVRSRGDAKAVVLDPLTHGRTGVKGQTGRFVVARGYVALGADERSSAGPVAIDVGAVSFGTWTPWRGAVEIPVPPDEGVK